MSQKKYHNLVEVSEGYFLFGDDETDVDHANAEERPKVKVWLDKYYIGKTPVSVSEWRCFVQETSYNWRYWNMLPDDIEIDCFPITYVNWFDCEQYCRWLKMHTGKNFSLPTEAQWEKACRGDNGNYYPNGNDYPDWEIELMSYARGEEIILQPKPVGRRPEMKTPYGCFDMWTNVIEWCHDWYDDSWIKEGSQGAYEKIETVNPKGADTGKEKILKGGCGLSSGWPRCSWKSVQTPDYKDDMIGFRIVINEI